MFYQMCRSSEKTASLSGAQLKGETNLNQVMSRDATTISSSVPAVECNTRYHFYPLSKCMLWFVWIGLTLCYGNKPFLCNCQVQVFLYCWFRVRSEAGLVNIVDAGTTTIRCFP
jgi:hypothetical protein